MIKKHKIILVGLFLADILTFSYINAFAGNNQNIGVTESEMNLLTNQKLKGEINNIDIIGNMTIEEKEKFEAERVKLEAETKKLNEEKDKLSRENRWGNVSILTQIFTPIFSLITVIISIVSVIKSSDNQAKTFEMQNKKNEDEHILSSLKELSSDKENDRILAIKGLSQYKSSIPYLINIIKNETNENVLSEVRIALSRMPIESLHQLVCENRNLFEKQLYIAGELVVMGRKAMDVSDKLNIDYNILNKWLQSEVKIKRIKDNLDEKVKQQGNEIINIENEDLSQWNSTCRILDEIIKAMSEVIKVGSVNIKTYDLSKTYLKGIELSSKNVSNWKFNDSYLCKSDFENAICIGASFSGISAKYSNFRGANLMQAVFNDAILDNSDLGKTELQKASFTRCNCEQTSFGGANLTEAVFDNLYMKKGKFSGSTGQNISFKGARIFCSEFMNVEYSNINFNGAKLNGSRFDGGNIINPKFNDNSDLSAIKINGANIDNLPLDKKYDNSIVQKEISIDK